MLPPDLQEVVDRVVRELGVEPKAPEMTERQIEPRRPQYLTEEEKQLEKEIARNLRENSLEGKTLTITEEIRKTHPDARPLGTWPDRMIFESDGKFFRTDYVLLESGKVQLPPAVELEGDVQEIDEALRREDEAKERSRY